MLFNENNEVIKNIEQKAVLVGINNGKDDISIKDSMEELKELAIAAGAVVLDSIIQNKSKIDPAYFIGKGKVDEIKLICNALDANMVIFNDELSESQIRNLEEKLEITIIDRTTLILDIFASRAKTKEAKLQVEVAQLRYRLPRLIGLGRSLSRTGGGIGTRGPGEQKLELDRRRILDKISDINRQLKEIQKNRKVQRAKRKRNQIPIIALVGYTNAGKSTLMNKFLSLNLQKLKDKKVYSENMLFATLDTYHRRIFLDDKKEFILMDTVGFVSKLPHHLIESFKATLEEVKEADLLIHVINSSNKNYDMQRKVTNKVLKELGVLNKPMIYAFNKCDIALDNICYPDKNSISISALTGYGIDKLIDMIKEYLFKGIKKYKMIIPFEKGNIYSVLCDKTKVYNVEYKENGIHLETDLDTALYNRYKQYIISS